MSDNPWPVRVALLASAGVVAAGIAYGAAGTVSALNPPPAPPTTSEEDGPPPERVTTSLLPSPSEEAEETEEAEEPRAAQEAPAAGTAPGTGGGDSGSSGGGTGGSVPQSGEGGADPREQILNDILNSPQPRPPLENLCDQACVDAHREAQEEAVVPETAAPGPEN
ncbi:hypothetical protein [Nocardiopsis algeriensis]|uniref:Uncharacterized protein n=1 Tax=Nocardiopsis algeriensis TaxID=1478215 RepID=A0A841IQ72_9ACTN|nr:hypothetical protein [Nocardiopsis algeriensis]MBB6120324.1 hypothetical protein [Nocardiopsis algeriensis]